MSCRQPDLITIKSLELEMDGLEVEKEESIPEVCVGENTHADKRLNPEDNKEGRSSTAKSGACNKTDKLNHGQEEAIADKQQQGDKMRDKNKGEQDRTEDEPRGMNAAGKKAAPKNDVDENEKEREKKEKMEKSEVQELGNLIDDQDHPLMTMFTEKQAELDCIIEEVAKRRNLTVLNVKSILRHVLKDKRVLALAEKKAAETEGIAAGQHKWKMNDIITIEPKLTRARVRQELESHGGISPEELTTLTNMIKMKSPMKKRPIGNEVESLNALLEESMASESSDEEYNPALGSGHEESDDNDDEKDDDDSDESDDDNESLDSEGEGEEELEEEDDLGSDSEDKDDADEQVCGDYDDDIDDGDDMKEEEEELEEEGEEEEEEEEEEGNSDEENTNVERKEILSDRDGESADQVVGESGGGDCQASSLSDENVVCSSVKVCAASSSISTILTLAKTCSSVISSMMSCSSSSMSSSVLPFVSKQMVNHSQGSTSTATKLSDTSVFSAEETTFSMAISDSTCSVSTCTLSSSCTQSVSISKIPPISTVAPIYSSTSVCIPSMPPVISSVHSNTSPSAHITTSPSSSESLSSPPVPSLALDTSPISPLPSPAALKPSMVSMVSPIWSPPLLPPCPPPSMSSCNSLVPTPDHALIYETAALLACMSDPSQSPMKGLSCMTDESPFKTSVCQLSPSKQGFTEAHPSERRPMKVCSNNRPSVSEACPIKPSSVEASVLNQMDEEVPLPELSEEGEIARRTRSKLPLNDTSIAAIEATFVPPDDEEPPTPSERAESVTMEEDEVEWQQWLGDLFNPSSPFGGNESMMSGCGEEDGDTEYNFPIDQLDDEKEEFRNDRAVRVSKKEVDELVNEYLYSSSGVNGLLSTDELDLTSAYLLQSLGLQNLLLQGTNSSSSRGHASKSSTLPSSLLAELSRAEGDVHLTSEQTVQLSIQIQQHYQLLMQTFLLSRFEPTLVHVAQLAAQAVKELHQLKLDAQSVTQTALWSIPCHEEGLNLISKLDPYKEDAVDLVPASGSPCRIPDQAQDIMMSCRTFWMFPQLLPKIGFASLLKEKQPNCNYTLEEDYLLVLGMDHYGCNNWPAIHENLLPIKTPKQLQLRVKNSCAKRSGDNVIKHFKKTKEVLIPYSKNEGRQRRFKEDELPDWVMNYYEKLERKEEKRDAKKEPKKKEKASESSCNNKALESSICKLLKLSGENVKTLSMKPESILRIGSVYPSSTSKERQSSVPVSFFRKPVVTAFSPAASTSDITMHAKRSLTPATASVPKRAKVKDSGISDEIGNSFGSERGSLAESSLDGATMGALTAGSLSEANMDLLLHAAGLEASSSSAKYSYRYLGEVKACLLGEDGIKRYDKFLEILVRGSKENMAPSQIYNEIRAILHPWPHLVQLFTEFLTPEDCLRADAMQEKCKVESVKSFITRLEEKFKDSPLKVHQVLNTLLSLDVPGITYEQIFSKVVPLIEAHKELVAELKQFLYQLAPLSDDGMFEEVSLLNTGNYSKWDQFENVTFSTAASFMNTQGRNSAFSTTYPTPSRQLFSHNQHFPISSPVVQSSSPVVQSSSPASSRSSSSSRSYKRSFKERPTSMNDSAQTRGIVKVLHPSAPPQKKAKTDEESCLSGISPHSQPDRHVGESSIVSKRKVPPRQRGSIRRSQPVTSLNKDLSNFHESRAQGRMLSGGCDSLVTSSWSETPEDLTCESITGIVTIRMKGSKGSSQLQTLTPHSLSFGNHLSEAVDRVPAGALSTASPKETDAGSHQEILQQTKKANTIQQITRFPLLPRTAITTLTSVSDQETTLINSPLQSRLVWAGEEVTPLSTPVSTPTHSTPKSLLSSSSCVVKSVSNKALTRRSRNGAHMQILTPTRRGNGWTREEDRVILKTCLHATMRLPEDSKCFGDIAVQLQRDPDEIKSRYGELFELYQSRKSKQQLSFPT